MCLFLPPTRPSKQEKQKWDSNFKYTEQHHLSKYDLKPDFVQMFSLKKTSLLAVHRETMSCLYPTKKENKIALWKLDK